MTVAWVIKFVSNNQRDGDYETFETLTDLAPLPKMIQDKSAHEVHMIRATNTAQAAYLQAVAARRANVR